MAMLEHISPKLKAWLVGGAVLAWLLASGLLWLTGSFLLFGSVGYFGTALPGAVVFYIVAPRNHKRTGRRLVMWVIGTFILALAVLSAAGLVHSVRGGFPGGQDVQVEGLFFALLAGSFAPSVLHYLVAKVVGPLFFGRIWCGWACWIGMVLDVLPFKQSHGRREGRWGWLRYFHFFASLGVVLFAWFALGLSSAQAWTGGMALFWFLSGTVLYYASGITLAFLLRDNRAFCKYICPVSVPLKAVSRFSLLKIDGDPARCNDHGECMRICPMDIKITDFVQKNRRVLSTECTLCQECIYACPENSLRLSFGWDRAGVGSADLLNNKGWAEASQ